MGGRSAEIMRQHTDQNPSHAEANATAHLENLRDAVFPCQSITSDPSGRCVECGADLDGDHGRERDPVEFLNEVTLEVVRLQKPALITWEDDDDEEQEYESEDFAEVLGFAFVLTTGGPHLEIRTADQGRTFTAHFWDWFGSDAGKIHLTGEDAEAAEVVFGQWFECFDYGHPYEMRTGRVADLTAEEAHDSRAANRGRLLFDHRPATHRFFVIREVSE